MKRILTICGLVSIAFTSLNAQEIPASAKVGEVWTIMPDFSDEFESTTLDTDKWDPNVNNFGVWSWGEDNVQVSNGTAKIIATQETHTRTFWNGCHQEQVRDFELYYKSGIIKSLKANSYGYYEASIKGAALFPGVCPAFWLFNKRDKTIIGPNEAQYNEIDIVELQQGDTDHGFGNNPKGMELNLHAIVNDAQGANPQWRRPKAFPEENLNVYDAPFDPREGFHTYGAHVREDSIIWYVDGIEVGRKANLYWHRAMNVTLSMGMRRQFVRFDCNQFYPNAVNTTQDGFPTTMEVEYVRVWQQETPLKIDSDGFKSGSLNELNVYPNPTQGNVTVDGLNDKLAEISIYNTQGQKFYQQSVQGLNKCQISLKDFPIKTYLLSVNIQGTTKIMKLQKQ